MSFWDGTRWVREEAAPKPPTSRLASWAATSVIVLGLVAMIIPTQFVAAASHRHAGTSSAGPILALSCDTSPCTVGGSLTVSGSNFTPSSGGQQVMLWVGYPNDYCSADLTVCHGFYVDPWVYDDGTFSLRFTNVLLQTGTGQVSATQYDAQKDKWVQVASQDYTVQ